MDYLNDDDDGGVGFRDAYHDYVDAGFLDTFSLHFVVV